MADNRVTNALNRRITSTGAYRIIAPGGKYEILTLPPRNDLLVLPSLTGRSSSAIPVQLSRGNRITSSGDRRVTTNGDVRVLDPVMDVKIIYLDLPAKGSSITIP